MTNRPSLFLHLPVHKTGSTALQQTLHSNEARLASRGYTYLPRFTHSFQHDDLTKKTGDALRVFLETMRDQAGGSSIILSTEKMHVADDDRIRDFLTTATEVFADYDIKVIVYLRRQDDAFSSFYNQIVKFGTTTETTAQAFTRCARFFNYERYLRLIRANLREADELLVRVYERSTLLDRDIVADFLQGIGLEIDLPDRPAKVINQSLEKSVFKMKRAMNQHLDGSPPELIQSLAGVLADASSRINNGKPDTNVLSDLERNLIMESYANSNRRVQEQYLNGASLTAEERPEVDYESSFEVVMPAVLARLSRYFYHIIRVAKR